MKAKDLFEGLGFKEIENNDDYLVYKGKISKHIEYEITFCKYQRCVEIAPKMGVMAHDFVRLDRKLLLAINMQIEELRY